MNKKCIVFIHGLDSNEDKTWRALQNIINEKKSSVAFNKIDFKYFGYESTKFTDEIGLAKKFIKLIIENDDKNKTFSSRIDKISQNLRSYLSREEFSLYESISIIAHSMGGLVSAKYILNELDNHRTPSINRILYICTPFLGSPFADICVKSGLNSPETYELTTYYTTIKKVISEHKRVEESVEATYFFGCNDEIISDCNDLFNYDSTKIIKGHHSTVLNSDNLKENYEYIEKFILNNGSSTFLEDLYKRARDNDHLKFKEKFIRKIDGPSSENIFKNQLDGYLCKEPNNKNIYNEMMEKISDLSFNPHEL